MKRFWKDVSTARQDGGWRVLLDGRPIRTQGGAAQVVPTAALADALAAEWGAQGETVDPATFPLRDLADYAIDQIAPEREQAIARLLPYAETDTLCYRADPDEPLYRRQHDLWEPILAGFEARHGLRLERISGVIHRPQPAHSMARLETLLGEQDDFTLSALSTLAPIAASLTVALEALEPGANVAALFTAANCEQEWQAELWGWDSLAEQARDARLAAFTKAAEFAGLAKG